VQRRQALLTLAALGASQAVCADEAALWPAETWPARTPAESGWSASGLQKAAEAARAVGSDAVLVVHRGAVVFDYGHTRQPVQLYSVRKSLLAVLLGMQVDAGKLKPDATLASLGIDDKQPLSEIEKTATVRQLMQARSGVYHPAAYETLDAKLQRPARGSHTPGSHWYYNNWDFNALGSIFKAASGQTVFEALATELAAPLMFEHFNPTQHTEWALENTSVHAAYTLQLSARDLARVGLLMARGGLFGARRVVSESWVNESTRAVSVAPPGWLSYALMWWAPRDGFAFWTHPPGSVFIALGNFGQLMWIDRSRDLVVVHNTDHRRWLRASPVNAQLAPLLHNIFMARPADSAPVS
jgi:CubicO group peptidase (beta-lactamase class C family)